MNKKAQKALIFAGVALALIACGDEVTEVTEQIGIQSFESVKKFPECNKENYGEIIASTEDGLIYYCADSSWQTLNGKDGINGENGVDGAKGEKGNIGENGATGANCSLVDNGDGTVTVTCGEKSTDLSKAVCGKESYDPTDKFCFRGKLYDYCGGKAYNPIDYVCKDLNVYGFLVDARDGKKYMTTTIGNQTWMAENLNYEETFYERGRPEIDSGSYCYDDTLESADRGAANCAKYGRLYTWAAAMDSINQGRCGYENDCVPDHPHRGICPEGWHIPTIAEFDTLINFIMEDQGLTDTSLVVSYLKSKNDWFLSELDSKGKNTYGFSALPSGIRYSEGNFERMFEYTNFWTASENTSTSAHCYVFASEYADLGNGVFFKWLLKKKEAISVRCIKDEE